MPGGTLATVPASTTAYTATGLTNGQSHTFIVQSISAVGFGETASVNATPSNVTAPSAPTSFTATGGNQQASLSWGASSSDGGSPVLHYRVYEDGSQVAEVDPPTASLVIIALTNGSTHAYGVTAVNAAGESPPASVTGVKIGTATGAPTGLSATPGDTQVALSWTAPSNLGGWPVTSYKVYRNGALAQTVTAPATTATITGLTNGQSSSFEVSAVNAIGESARSSAASATPRALPTVPQNVQVAEGNHQLTITWGAPASDGGSAVTAYRFFSGGQQVAEVPATPRSFNPTGLTNGQTYSFQIAAVNAAGEGPKTSVVSGTPGTTPGAPQSLSATPGNGQVAVSWAAPADAGGRTVTSYRVYRNGTLAQTVTAPTTTATVTGLTNGQSSSFEVAAVTALGEGTHAGPVSATPRGAPTVPQNLQMTSGDRQLVITWDAPSSDGGSAVTAYRLFSGGTQVAELPATPRSLTATGLTNGQTYSLQLAAVNAAGEGPRTAVTSATPGTTPSAPRNLSATPGDRQVALTWIAPADDGGRSLTAYRVYLNGTLVRTVTPPATTATVTGLTNGQAAVWAVRAVNALGEGASAEVAASPRTVPGAPQSFAAQPRAGGEIALTWAAPSSNGGAILEGWRVYRNGQRIADVAVGSLGYTDSGRTVGQNYSYEVSAVNAAGEGTHAGPVTLVAATVPTVPRNLRVEARDGNVLLTWDAPTDNGGRPITDYEILVDGQVDGLATNPQSRSYVVAELTNGRTYRFEVGARNAVGRGPTAVANDFPELQTTITVSLGGDNQARVGGVIHTTATVTNVGARAVNGLVVTGSLTTCAAPGASPLAPGAHVDVPCTRTAVAGDVSSVPATVNADAHNAAPVDSNTRRTWVFPASGYTDMTQALFAPGGDWARYRQLTPANLQSTAFYTRAQAIRLLWQFMGSPTGFGAHRFVDVPANVNYVDAVKWGRARGILDLPTNREFDPGQLLTRQALIVWMYRMAGSPTGAPAAGYTDTAGLSGAVRKAIDWAHFRGVVHEANANKFKPTVTPARQSALYMIWRLASTKPAWNSPPDGLPASAVFVCCEPGEPAG